MPRSAGGQPFSRGHLYKLLSNPLYVGEIVRKGTRYPSQHPAIIDAETWDAVQAQLAANTRGSRSRPNTKEPSLLSGLLFDDRAERLTATHAVKSGKRYRYYAAAAQGNGSAAFRISAGDIEPVVISQIVAFLGRTGELVDGLGAGQLGPDVLKEAMARAKGLAAELQSGSGPVQRQIVLELVDKVTIGAAAIRIELKHQALAARLLDLAFLPPKLIEDILDGRQPVDMTVEQLSRSERPLLWTDA